MVVAQVVFENFDRGDPGEKTSPHRGTETGFVITFRDQSHYAVVMQSIALSGKSRYVVHRFKQTIALYHFYQNLAILSNPALK